MSHRAAKEAMAPQRCLALSWRLGERAPHRIHIAVVTTVNRLLPASGTHVQLVDRLHGISHMTQGVTRKVWHWRWPLRLCSLSANLREISRPPIWCASLWLPSVSKTKRQGAHDGFPDQPLQQGSRITPRCQSHTLQCPVSAGSAWTSRMMDFAPSQPPTDLPKLRTLPNPSPLRGARSLNHRRSRQSTRDGEQLSP